MKKYLLSATLFLITWASVFAQDGEEHSAEYQWGERNALWVILGLLVAIILIVWAVRRRRR